MNKLNPFKPSPKLLIMSAAFCFALHHGTSSAQQTLISPIVNNGGFESITAKTNFTTNVSTTGGSGGATGVPYWGATGVNTVGAAATIADSGAELGGNSTQAGAKGGYFRATDSTAFNLATSYTIKAGDQFTLTWFALSSGATLSTQAVQLFSQAPVTATPYTYSSATFNLISTTVARAGYTLSQDDFVQYTLTGVATAADAGKIVGFTFGNGGEPTNNINNTFVTADTFSLTVVPVPEPSTYAFLGAGLVGLGLMLRSRRAQV